VNRGIWWANKEVVKVGFAENYLLFDPCSSPAGFSHALVEAFREEQERDVQSLPASGDS